MRLSSGGYGSDRAMRGERATSLLKRPVRSRGLQLGRPVDLLLDLNTRRALGFDVRCGDETHRFLPFAAAELNSDELRVGSALTLLDVADGLAFYRARGTSLRSLLGGFVVYGSGKTGRVDDVVVGEDGTILEFLVREGGRDVRVPDRDAVRITPRGGRSAA